MTNTKHKPATPLPWEAMGEMLHCGGNHSRIIAASFDRSANGKRGDALNAAYAAHAANAYPKLVEALRRSNNALMAAREIACSRPMMESPLVTDLQTCGGAVNEATSLLRSLGEEV